MFGLHRLTKPWQRSVSLALRCGFILPEHSAAVGRRAVGQGDLIPMACFLGSVLPAIGSGSKRKTRHCSNRSCPTGRRARSVEHEESRLRSRAEVVGVFAPQPSRTTPDHVGCDVGPRAARKEPATSARGAAGDGTRRFRAPGPVSQAASGFPMPIPRRAGELGGSASGRDGALAWLRRGPRRPVRDPVVVRFVPTSARPPRRGTPIRSRLECHGQRGRLLDAPRRRRPGRARIARSGQRHPRDLARARPGHEEPGFPAIRRPHIGEAGEEHSSCCPTICATTPKTSRAQGMIKEDHLETSQHRHRVLDLGGGDRARLLPARLLPCARPRRSARPSTTIVRIVFSTKARDALRDEAGEDPRERASAGRARGGRDLARASSPRRPQRFESARRWPVR